MASAITARQPHRRDLARRGQHAPRATSIRGMTFAAVYNAPVIFNVVNNQWAISQLFRASPAPSGRRSPRGRSATASPASGSTATIRWRSMPRCAWAADRARSNNGPTLIEHFTYRAEGHSTSRRSRRATARREEREEWPLGDPIMRLKQHLIALGEWSEEQHAEHGPGAGRSRSRRPRRRPRRTASSATGCTPVPHDVRGRVRGAAAGTSRSRAEQAIRERQIKWPQ